MLYSLGAADPDTTANADSTPWLDVHRGAEVLFSAATLAVWQMIRGIPGRAAAVARAVLRILAVAYGVVEVLFEIATGVVP